MGTMLLEKGTVVTLNETDSVLVPGYVYIEGGTIAAVGEGPAPEEMRQQAGQVLDCSRKALLPGLVNAHVHLFQSFVRGPGGDRALLEWLRQVAWPVFQNMTGEDIYLAAMVSLLENIRGGATAIIDNHYVHQDQADDEVCRAAEEMGIRYMLARGWADHDYHPTMQEEPQRIIAEMERLYHTWHGRSNGRITVEFGPLIPWACSEHTLLRTYELAQAWGTGIHMHVAETQAEVEMSLQRTGMRHVEWLADLGILGPHMQLVHSVWLSDREIDLVAQSGSVVVHCPVSNMFLASGIARIAEMARQGIVIALATDGQACSNGEEMLDMLRITSNLQKIGGLDALALTPQQVLRMACRGGAAALGRRQQMGCLEAGKAADLVVLSLDIPRMMQMQSVPSSLVNFARRDDLCTVIVDGRLLMHDGKVLVVDEEDLMREARLAYRHLLLRAGVGTVNITAFE